MPQYDITSPDGSAYRVDGPDGSSEKDALAYVQKNHDKLKALPVQPAAKAPDASDSPAKIAAGGASGGMLGVLVAGPLNQNEQFKAAWGAVKEAFNTGYPLGGSTEDWQKMGPLGRGLPGAIGRYEVGATQLAGRTLDAAVSAPIAAVMSEIYPDEQDRKIATNSFKMLLSAVPVIAEGEGAGIRPPLTEGAPKEPFDPAKYAADQEAKSAAKLAGQKEAAHPKAVETVLRNLKQDLEGSGLTSEQIAERIAKANARGETLSLADFPELKNIQRLAGEVYRRPGQAAAALERSYTERGQAAAGHLERSINDRLSSGQSVYKTVNEVADERSAAAAPLYEKALAPGSVAPLETQFQAASKQAAVDQAAAAKELNDANARLDRAHANVAKAPTDSAAMREIYLAEKAVRDASEKLKTAVNDRHMAASNVSLVEEAKANGVRGAVWSPRLQRMLDDPIMRPGIAEGLKLERLEALNKNRIFDPRDYAVVGQDANGEPIVGKVLNMKVLQAAKEGLDHMLFTKELPHPGTGAPIKLVDATTGRPTKLWYKINELRGNLLAEMDRLNPDYKPARQAWAGPTRSMEVAKWGENLIQDNSLTHEMVQDFVKDLSPGEKEFAQLGLASKLREEIRTKSVTSPVIRQLSRASRNAEIKDKLRPLFNSDKEFNDFLDSATDQRAIFEAEGRILRGSQSAERLGADQMQPLEDARTAVGGVAKLLRLNPAGALDLYNLHRDIGVRNNPALNSEIVRLLTDPNAEGILPRNLQSATQDLGIQP